MNSSLSYYNANPTPNFPRNQQQPLASSTNGNIAYNQQLSQSNYGQVAGKPALGGQLVTGQQQPSMQSINGMVRNDQAGSYYPMQQSQQVQAPQAGPAEVAALQQPAASIDAENPALFVPLKTAKDAVENMMINDESILSNGLDDYLGGGTSSSITVNYSNLYISPSSAEPSSVGSSPLVQTRKVDFPQGIFAMLRGKDSHVTQGLLPEIGRTWYAVNGVLIMWDYTIDGEAGLVRVDHDAGNMVHSVGLVKADPTLFQGLSHLLVVAGNARVSLLGLSYDSSNRSLSVVHMLPNQRFLSATSPANVRFSQIACTHVGSRVFLLGNGCLWEMVYEARIGSDKGWLGVFGGRVKDPVVKNWTMSFEGWGNLIPLLGSRRESLRQLAIDPEREILYGLTTDNKVQRWTISRGGNGLEPKAETALLPVDQARKHSAGNPFLDLSVGVIRIDVVSKMESDACLVVTTTSNSRIYVKDGTQSRAMGYSYAPNGLHVSHIRYPMESVTPIPGAGPVRIASRPLASSRYIHGVYATIHHTAGTDEPSELVWYAADPFEWADLAAKRQQGQMIPQDVPGRGQGFPESFGLMNLSSQVVDVGEEPEFWNVGDWALRRVVKGSSGQELSVKETHEMVTEVTVGHRRRFVVMTSGGVVMYEKTRPMDLLEHLYANGLGRTEVVLAIQRQLSSSVSPLLAVDIAIAAQNGSNGELKVRDYIPGIAAQGALDHLVNWANEQQKQKTLYHQSANAAQWKLDAVYLHLSRSLRTLWKSNVLALNPATQVSSSAVSIAKLQSLQSKLEGIQSLLINRANIFSSIDPTFVSTASAKANPNSDSFNPPRVLLAQTIEAIAFVILLSEFKFETVLLRCDPNLQKELSMLTYQQLIIDPRGRDIAKRLVTNVVNQQISQDLSIELISDKLQERCPSFCSRADVELYKAMESLRKAKELRSGVEQQAHLDSALDNFMRAAPGLSEEKIREVCTEFCSLGYTAGCIQLPIEKAERVDPKHLAFTYYLDGRPDGDARKTAYEDRLKFYLLALSAVEKFDNDAAQQGPGSEAARIKHLAYDYALNTGDDLFLMTLYQWMVQKGKSDQLLEMEDDVKVEAYLRYRGLSSGEPGLLWRFYARRNRHYMAARALRELAEAEIALPMAQRVESLALASMHAKSSTMQEAERAPVDFVTELEEINDVANIQLEIWQAIANDPEVTEAAAAKAEQLQSRLISISELYSDFAEPLRLYECQLAVLHASDHRDADLVSDVWNAMLLRATEDASDLPANQQYQPFRDLVIRMGKRFYPSQAAFPTNLIVRSYYDRGYDQTSSPSGWVTDALIEAGIAYREIWDTLSHLVQDQPPYEDLAGKRYLDRELAVLLPRWIEAAATGKDQPFFPGVTEYLTLRAKSRDIEQDNKTVFERGMSQIVDLLRSTRTF